MSLIQLWLTSRSESERYPQRPMSSEIDAFLNWRDNIFSRSTLLNDEQARRSASAFGLDYLGEYNKEKARTSHLWYHSPSILLPLEILARDGATKLQVCIEFDDVNVPRFTVPPGDRRCIKVHAARRGYDFHFAPERYIRQRDDRPNSDPSTFFLHPSGRWVKNTSEAYDEAWDSHKHENQIMLVNDIDASIMRPWIKDMDACFARVRDRVLQETANTEILKNNSVFCFDYKADAELSDRIQVDQNGFLIETCDRNVAPVRWKRSRDEPDDNRLNAPKRSKDGDGSPLSHRHCNHDPEAWQEKEANLAAFDTFLRSQQIKPLQESDSSKECISADELYDAYYIPYLAISQEARRPPKRLHQLTKGVFKRCAAIRFCVVKPHNVMHFRCTAPMGINLCI